MNSIIPMDNAQHSPLKSVTVNELLNMELPERELIMAPWLTKQGLAMIYAPRGVGKTHMSLGIACAVSAGEDFLGWEVDKPRGVLFIDGEMPANLLQERLSGIINSMDNKPVDELLTILTPDFQDIGIPDLASHEGQQEINKFINSDTDLIIIDNISTIVKSGKENEAESWMPVQNWAIKQRSEGRTVLFIHHSGKNGQQRGTSRREDALDTVITLKRPSDYTPELGACFEVHFEKARGLLGDDVAAFRTQLKQNEDDCFYWDTQLLDDSNYEKMIAMLNDGLSQADISKELGLNKSTISRHAKKARESGRLE